LAKKIRVLSLPDIPFDENINPLLDWNANLFTVQHTQYVILTNTSSLYSLIMYGKGILDERKFIRKLFTDMNVFMLMSKNESLFNDVIGPERRKILFSMISNKRVMESMNDLVHLAKFHLGEDRQTLFGTSVLLNETPMSYLNDSSPKEEFQKLYLTKKEPMKHLQKKNNNVIHINDLRAMKKKFDIKS